MKMKKPFLFFWVFSAVLLGAAETEIPFAVGEWSPYVGEQLPEYGYAAQIVQAACAAAGLRARFEFFPWPRAEMNAAEGRVFAAFPYLSTPEREAPFFFSAPILYSSIGILRSSGNVKTKSFVYKGNPGEFSGYRVGTLAGTFAVIDPLRKSGVYFETTPTLEQSIRKLEKGRIDFVLDERIVVADAVRRLYPDRPGLLYFVERDFTEKRGYLLLVSKKYPDSKELLEKFNSGLAKIRADGTLDRIRARNGL